jgi:hypothetical protein
MRDCLCETGKTYISEQPKRILPWNYDTEKTDIREKAALYMKILIFHRDWPGFSNRRDKTQFMAYHDTLTPPFRDVINDRPVDPKQKPHN